MVAVGIYQTHKALPTGLSLVGVEHAINPNQLDFLYDLTYTTTTGEIKHEQIIFDEIITAIGAAEHYILADMFLFNPWLGQATSSHRDLAGELSQALIAQKTAHPDIKIDLITDPINTVYGGGAALPLSQLQAAGINVIITNLKSLRDSNPTYSGLWRSTLQWLGNSTRPGWIKHPFSISEDSVSLRSYLSLLNFKANHRKVFLADRGDDYVSIVSSANPHSASAAHSNVALKISGNAFAQDLWQSEQAVAELSGRTLFELPETSATETSEDSSVQLLTEAKIKDNIISLLQQAGPGDQVGLAMFYLSSRDIVQALLEASKRGAAVRLILDPNRDAFGYEKSGIPNRPVAHELVEKSGGAIKVRWYDTHGEQFHAKLVFANFRDGRSWFILGSANLTRRNIDNYNLESNVLVKTERFSALSEDINTYFTRLWTNEGQATYTTAYNTYADDSTWKSWLYRVQESSGLGSF